ncbi:MAG: AAA family ATPase [Thaumarchaeota archaeon]|nr:AAA family ATPase [Candidatus Calditenuaceae archaeon]MCX8203054.1 AAA family ATPase [Nitrososphaeria archaeon]MDW8042745.1 nucleoside-triphosphatase [Nitrososphaerota archaeon]
MRRLVVITGPPGSGKTTAAIRVAEELRSRGLEVGGFVTREVREGGARIGFDVVELSGASSVPLARKGPSGPHRLGSYAVFPENLEELGIPAITAAVERGAVLIVDEVGPMELMSRRFVEAVGSSVSSLERSLFTVHFRAKHPLIERLNSSATLRLVVRFGEAERVAREAVNHLLG